MGLILSNPTNLTTAARPINMRSSRSQLLMTAVDRDCRAGCSSYSRKVPATSVWGIKSSFTKSPEIQLWDLATNSNIGTPILKMCCEGESTNPDCPVKHACIAIEKDYSRSGEHPDPWPGELFQKFTGKGETLHRGGHQRLLILHRLLYS